ncbi:MAG: LON peptidase substrate-binding domain-containing protein, partial [Verrucomicrobiae bacterium]|nr:LON peptidase substrate-binding domain-containing protein [Verrucomicrobiae bacterium]
MAIDSADTEFITITTGRVGADEGTTRISSRALPEVLPILGLADIVIYPGQEAPLLVDTPEGVRLIDDVVAGDRLLGVVLQRKPDVQNPTPEDLYSMGCAVHVSRMLKFPDNTVRILVQGLWRIRITEYKTEAPYLRARFEVCKDVVEDSLELEALTRNVQNLFREIIRLSPALSELDKVLDLESERPGRLADMIAWTLNFSLADRQELLETVSVKQRLQKLLPLLNRERQVLELSSKIQSEVAASISRTQRDYFLREQLRAIQRELGEADSATSELRALREQIENTPMPAEARKVALQEIERLQHVSPAAAEYAIARHYLDWIVNLPWEKETEDKLDLAEAERILNEQHYGLTKVKDRLL